MFRLHIHDNTMIMKLVTHIPKILPTFQVKLN